MVADGRAVLAEVPRLRPDIVVLDIAMPVLNGLDAARQLRQSAPEVKIIFLTASEDADIAVEAFRLGASGYLVKSSAASELLWAVREVSLGRSYITPLATRGLIDALLGPHEPARKSIELEPRVSGRCWQLLAEGNTMKEIAHLLKITPRTVAFHKYSMMELLGVKSSRRAGSVRRQVQPPRVGLIWPCRT